MAQRDASHAQHPVPRGLLLAAGFCFLLFVAYGSLVPLNFQPKPLSVAWREFLNIPYLDIALKHREDFVANILLYIPIGLCFTGALGPANGRFRPAVGIAVFILGVTAGTVIEFTQLFFPGRTVSINDMAANVVGTAIGISVWWGAGPRLSDLIVAVRHGGPVAIRAAMVIYVLAYLVLSLFPFDFLLTAAELRWKLDSDRYGLLFAGEVCNGALRCSVKLMAEGAAAAPLGLLASMLMTRRARGVYATSLVGGCILGGVIEAGQFFIYSGYSQGMSVLTRGMGVALGVAAHRAASLERFERARPYLRPVAALAVAPYLLLLAALNGWFSAPWTDPATALAKLARVSFIPFYYHYFTTETVALQSLLQIATAYFPVGLGYWMWRTGQRRPWPDEPLIPAALAAVLALVIETGKLFVPERRPDPTDVLIAACSSYLAYAVARAILRWTVDPAPADPPTPTPQQQPVAAASSALAGTGETAARRRRRVPAPARAPAGLPLTVLWSIPLVILLVLLLVLHPYTGRLAACVAVYALFLWRWPRAALPAALALLPLANFAPWTGWVLFDEFDVLMTATIAVWLMRRVPVAAPALPHRRAGWLIALLALSCAASLVAGLLPFQTFDQSALTSYYGSLNALRVAKGFVWALALLPLLDEAMREGSLERRLLSGIVPGLCVVAAVAIWQRAAIAGLLDFSTDYRIAATFPETHVGGGDVEAYLVMALPLTVAWIALRPVPLRVAAGTALFAAGSYALAVTFARAGYLAYACMLALLAAGFALHRLRQRGARPASLALACGLAVAAIAVMVPIMSSSFMQARFAAAQPDGALRVRHWTDALDMVDSGAGSALVGMGLGSYPKTYLLKNPAGAVPATFSYLHENGNGYVRLGSGLSLYLDQRVAAAPGQSYTVALDLRSADPTAGLSVALCEKTEQHAFRCKRLAFDVKAPGGKWSRETLALDSGEVGAGPWLLRPPVTLVLSNPRAGTRVDVDNVSLRESGGRELVANGDFSRAGARWFFTTDQHVQWHVDNVWVHVLFEQGWLGVLAFALAIVAALARLAASTWRGDVFSAALLASLSGCLVVGLFNSLLDGPRVAALFFVLLFTALLRPRAQDQKQSSRR